MVPEATGGVDLTQSSVAFTEPEVAAPTGNRPSIEEVPISADRRPYYLSLPGLVNVAEIAEEVAANPDSRTWSNELVEEHLSLRSPNYPAGRRCRLGDGSFAFCPHSCSRN